MKPVGFLRFFSNGTIAWQLNALQYVMIAAFVLMGSGYAASVVLQNQALAENAKVNEFRKAATEIAKQTLQARRDEKDFLLRRDDAYATEHAQVMKALRAEIEQAETLAPDKLSADKVLEVKAQIEVYAASFGKVADAHVKLGLDETSGSHGRMREAIHGIEQATEDANLDKLTVFMLQMRRHEKDFIQRGDAKYVDMMKEALMGFNAELARATLDEKSRENIKTLMVTYQDTFKDFVAKSNAAVDDSKAMREAVRSTEPLVADLDAHAGALLKAADESLATKLMWLSVAFVGLVLFGAAIVITGLLSVSRAVRSPLGRLTEVIKQLAEGDDSARAGIESKNEFGDLGNAFDQMMEEKVATQNAIRRENEQLNESVLKLLQAVAQLARKDLTVKVPVTEDVTGAVADALNLLTVETGRVLREVSDISADVTSASLKVKEQADNVMLVAADGRREAEQTAESLSVAATTMGEIADLAQVCNVAADNAIKTTQQALKAVADTVGGINATRDTIRETEKRIKRLGERSQEISGVVNLINTIAERTHILALNASMHAASAGEAGRGFAVVADEVQRLAENARQATAQIASLVNNIQVETQDTVSTMNAAIAQVVEGSKLAEQASDRMQQTEEKTAELVSVVQRIAVSSTEQAKASNELLRRASEIRKSTEETSRKIDETGQYTNNLVEYAKNLLSTVRVFKLPA